MLHDRDAFAAMVLVAGWTLLEIWRDLQAEFGLGRVTISLDPGLRGRGSNGLYEPDAKRITLGVFAPTEWAVKVLLHEARHAIQDVRGEMPAGRWSWKTLWRLEHDAETFALREYAARFEARFGPLPPYRRWEHKRTLRRAFEREKAEALAY